MKFAGSFAILSAVIVTLVATPPVAGQADFRAQVRGIVRDAADAAPLPDVTVEFAYTGEKQGRVSTFKVKTNKKGGFVRIGLVGGPYKLTFFKDGYKMFAMETFLSGGLSELPDISLEKVPEGTRQLIPPGASKEDIEAAKARAEATSKLLKVTQDAMVAVEAQDWDTAERLLQEVLKSAPNQPLVYINIGVVARKKGDLPAAEAAYRKAVELDPSDGESYAMLGIILESQNRGTEGVDLLQAASPRFEGNKAFQGALGALAMNAGRSEEAEAAFKRVIAVDPTNADVHFHLATLSLNKNQTAVAVSHLEQCVANAAPGSANGELAKQLLAALKKK
jgi:tetratricopeptide (TPR) repeat protein